MYILRSQNRVLENIPVSFWNSFYFMVQKQHCCIYYLRVKKTIQVIGLWVVLVYCVVW
jgi:hypothetical protein